MVLAVQCFLFYVFLLVFVILFFLHHCCFCVTQYIMWWQYLTASDKKEAWNGICWPSEFWVVGWLILNVPVNNFSVMLGRSHRFLGITSTFWGVNVPCSRAQHGLTEWGSNPRPLDPESKALTTRPPRSPNSEWRGRLRSRLVRQAQPSVDENRLYKTA